MILILGRTMDDAAQYENSLMTMIQQNRLQIYPVKLKAMSCD